MNWMNELLLTENPVCRFIRFSMGLHSVQETRHTCGVPTHTTWTLRQLSDGHWFFVFVCCCHTDSLRAGISRIIVNFLLRPIAVLQRGNARDGETDAHRQTAGYGHTQTNREIKRIIVNFLPRRYQVDRHEATWLVCFLFSFFLLISSQIRIEITKMIGWLCRYLTEALGIYG